MANTQAKPAPLAAKTIGFLGGGNMAAALIRGLLHSETVKAEQIRASDVKPERLAELHGLYKIETTEDNEALVRWSDVIVLAVKPQIVDRVLAAVSAGLKEGAVVVSIAAGVPIDAMEARLPKGARVVRSMPNTAAIALAAATAIAPEPTRRRAISPWRGRSSKRSGAAWCSTRRCSTP